MPEMRPMTILGEAFARWCESMELSGAAKLAAYAHFVAGWEAAYGSALETALRFAQSKDETGGAS